MKIEDDSMKTEHEIIVADLRDFRLAQMTAAANALADDQLETCIRHLQNIISTVPKESNEWKEMTIASKDFITQPMKLSAKTLKKIPVEVLRFENTSEKARMFYDKMFDILLRYTLIKD
jgi:hypothetical protein